MNIEDLNTQKNENTLGAGMPTNEGSVVPPLGTTNNGAPFPSVGQPQQVAQPVETIPMPEAPTMQNLQPTENIAEPIPTQAQVIPPIAQATAPQLISEGIDSLGSTNLNQPPVNNIPQINLQPEGMTPPPEEMNVEENPQPLMGTTLTANSNLTKEPIQEPTLTPPPNVNNTINTINPLENTPTGPQNPFDLNNGAVPAPPTIDNNKGKKNKSNQKISKPLLILLIIALIAGIGYGVYFFLNTSSKNSVTVVTTLASWEKGETLPESASSYANISGVDESTCTVDKSKINQNTAGTYEYSVSCPGLSNPVTGSVVVKDSQGPIVETKEIVALPNSDVNINDFIASCRDASIENGCDVKLKEGEPPLEELVTTVGTYTINLIVSDDFDNKTEVTASLKIDNSAPETTLSCIYDNIDTTTKAVVKESYEYGFTAENTLYNAKKIVTFKFDNQNDYEEQKTSYEETKTIDNLTGTAKFEDPAMAIILTVDLELDNLATEFGIDSFPQSMSEIVIYHESQKASCSLS